MKWLLMELKQISHFKDLIMNDKVFKKGGMNIHYLEKMLGEEE